jgi:voltage-gated potassium channel Kch
MARTGPHLAKSIAFSAALILLISFAVVDVINGFVVVMLASVVAAVIAFYRMFPGSRFVTIAFANSIAIYACIFVYFVEANFARAHFEVVLLCFTLPIATFLLGAWLRRAEIRAIVTSEHEKSERRLGRVVLWLVPVFVVGAASFVVSAHAPRPAESDAALGAAMVAIAATVLFVSRDVSTFLLDTGLLFEEFFERITGLVAPAFAFFTFYSLLVIAFGSVYRILDRVSPEALFRIDGALRKISFAEALYFSIVTLSTVGYGDIVPIAALSRIVASAEIVSGILLLLFGFSEIIAYTRDRRDRRH